MRVFLTGGAGYIGSVTAQRLLDEGHEVTIFDNLERGHRAAVDPRARFIEGDLRERANVREALVESRADAVMHFAAYAQVGESMRRPNLYFQNNVAGGLNLIEAMLHARVRRIVFSSTCATYGAPARIPMDEALPQRPENAYGESKLMLERALTWAARAHDLEPVFLRYFNAAGATEYGEDHRPETHLIPLVLEVAAGAREAIQVFGDDYETRDGTCVRDYIHVRDLAEAHLLALGEGISGAFNLGSGEGYTVREVIEAARRVTGHPIPAEVTPRRPGDAPALVADAAKARAALGWAPRLGLEEMIQDAWAWRQAHPHGYEAHT